MLYIIFYYTNTIYNKYNYNVSHEINFQQASQQLSILYLGKISTRNLEKKKKSDFLAKFSSLANLSSSGHKATIVKFLIRGAARNDNPFRKEAINPFFHSG